MIRILYKQEYYPLTAPIRDKKPTYTARHSFSTILKRSGAYIEFASENLGHADFKTTENYLDSFEDGMKREFAN